MDKAMAQATQSHLTIQQIADETKVSNETLDQKCSEDDLLAFAGLCDPWDIVGLHLKLSQEDISAIDQDKKTTEQKRVGVLYKWKQKFALKATYRTLVKAFIACDRIEQAHKICKALAEKQGSFCGGDDNTDRHLFDHGQLPIRYGREMSEQAGVTVSDISKVHFGTDSSFSFEVLTLNVFERALPDSHLEYSTFKALLDREVVARDAVCPLLPCEGTYTFLSQELKSSLLRAIYSAVKADCAKFQSLIEVLKKDIVLNKIADEMESTFRELQDWFSGEVSDYVLLKLSEIESGSLPEVSGLSENDLQDVYNLGYGCQYTRFEILLKWKKSSKTLTLETVFLTLMKLSEYRDKLGTGEVIYQWLEEAKGIVIRRKYIHCTYYMTSRMNEDEVGMAI